MSDAASRCFLFLQGPHGPFFDRLGAHLREAGCTVWRVGFNRGDERFWHDKQGYLPYTDKPDAWPGACQALMAQYGVTDLVVYGDTRPIHAEAIAEARARGITVHVFEEGYLRPYWATYERGGSNGHSQIMAATVAEMQAALPDPEEPPLPAPAHWGDMRQHMFYGALYHFHVLFRNKAYNHFRPHRAIGVAAEFRLYLRRFMLLPLHRAERSLASLRIRWGRFRYHLVLMQLEHDASFRDHSDFASMTDFIALCLQGFAEGAHKGDHLVFKAHPLEDGRVAVKPTIARIARELGLYHRVHFVRGGKLASLLNRASSVVTVNSTAAQQALWRGLAVRAFGRAVYDKPEFVSHQPLPEFFAAPKLPDIAAYLCFRRYLLQTSQLPGGFYSTPGRRLLLARLPALMLSPHDPYARLTLPNAAHAQHSAAHE